MGEGEGGCTYSTGEVNVFWRGSEGEGVSMEWGIGKVRVRRSLWTGECEVESVM